MDGYVDLTWPIQDLKVRPVVMKDAFMKSLDHLSALHSGNRYAEVEPRHSFGVMMTLEEPDILDEDDTILVDGKIDYTELDES